MLEQAILAQSATSGMDLISLGWDLGEVFGGAVFGAAVTILVFASRGFFTEVG